MNFIWIEESTSYSQEMWDELGAGIACIKAITRLPAKMAVTEEMADAAEEALIVNLHIVRDYPDPGDYRFVAKEIVKAALSKVLA